jgi:tetratricopeptide (TPR) repeat protein
VQNNLAVIYAEHFDELGPAYELASKARTSHPQHPGIADRYRVGEEFAKAAAACEQAIAVNPNLLAAIIMLAELHSGPLDDPAKAMTLARQARDLAPDDATIAAAVGKIAYKAGNITWAHSLLQDSLRTDPRNPDKLLALAWASYRLGLSSESATKLREVLEIAPGTPSAMEAQRFLTMLSIYLDRSRLSSIQGEVEQALRESPGHLPALMVEAARLESAGKYRESIAALRKILQQVPDFPLAQIDLSRNLARSGEADSIEAAHQLAKKARQTLPSDPRATIAFAEANYRLEKYQYSIGLLEELQRTKALDVDGLCLLGLSQFHNDDPEADRPTLQRAVSAGLREPLRSEATKLLQED